MASEPDDPRMDIARRTVGVLSAALAVGVLAAPGPPFFPFHLLTVLDEPAIMRCA